jgi:hypothetical protein
MKLGSIALVARAGRLVPSAQTALVGPCLSNERRLHAAGGIPRRRERQLKRAPRTRALAEGDMDEVPQECVRKGMKLIFDESGEDENACMVSAIDPDSALIYMRMGCRRAERWFAGSHPYEISRCPTSSTKSSRMQSITVSAELGRGASRSG